MWTQKIDLKWIDVNLTFLGRWFDNIGREYLQIRYNYEKNIYKIKIKIIYAGF